MLGLPTRHLRKLQMSHKNTLAHGRPSKQSVWEFLSHAQAHRQGFALLCGFGRVCPKPLVGHTETCTCASLADSAVICESAVRTEVLSVPGCCCSSTACEIWHEAFENSYSKLESQWVIKSLLQLKSIRVGDGGGREDAGVRGYQGSRLQSMSEWQTAGTPQGYARTPVRCCMAVE